MTPFARIQTFLVAGVLALLTGVVAVPSANADTELLDHAAAFAEAYPDLSLEDFEGSSLPAGTIASCGPEALSSSAGGTCYAAGALTPGIRYVDDPESGDYAMAGITAGFNGYSSTAILTDQQSDALIIDLTSEVDTIGFRLATTSGTPTGSCTVSVHYVDLSAATTATVGCPVLPAMGFVGIKSDRLIDYVRVIDPGAASETIDDVRFGLRAPNEFQVIKVRQQRATGTARLSVRVPTTGTLKLAGTGVAPAQVDAAYAKTVFLTVRARKEAKEVLDRRGRVTVTVRLEFAPNDGTSSTQTRRVTLVRR